MKNSNKIGSRLFFYLFGLFIMAIGISFSVKSKLGVSPVSSIPYTITCVFGMELGNATILFHTILVLIQIILLRKNFKLINIFQIAAGIVFGKFITLSNVLISNIMIPETIFVRIILLVISIILIAIGIFFYMPADIMPLAAEGVIQAVSEISGIEFPKVKVGFDMTMVTVSLITCLIVLHRFGSIGAGTILAAVFVGVVLGIIKKYFGEWRDKL
ncbi:MAG: YitT family protein [Eubacterium sp.]